MSPDQRRTLEAWVRAQNTPQSVALRARIVLLAADGLPNSRIAREVGVSNASGSPMGCNPTGPSASSSLKTLTLPRS